MVAAAPHNKALKTDGRYAPAAQRQDVRRTRAGYMAIPELEQERASRALRRYCEKVPLEIRDKLTKDFRFVRSDVELFERRPHYSKRHRHVELVVAKFRYNAKRGSWTLFWSDRNLRWHAYKGLEDRRDFLELLREVEADPTCIFWG